MVPLGDEFKLAEIQGDRLIIPDLTSEKHWGDAQLGSEDHEWLRSVAELPVENFMLNVEKYAAHTIEKEPILLRDIDGWRANRYIGEIRHKGRTLEIRPRLGVDTVASWVSTILNVQVLPNTASRSTEVSSTVTQLLAAVWRAEVLSAGQHALLKTPRRLLSNGLTIRGRLDVQGTVRRRAFGNRDLVSNRVVRAHDNAASRAVVLADRYLDSFLEGTHWRGSRIDEHLTALRRENGPNPTRPTMNEIRKTKYNPITIKWRRAAELSLRIIENDPLGVSANAESTHGVLIDAAELWERFILNCVSRASDEQAKHGAVAERSGALARSVRKPRRSIGNLYPDVVVGEDPVLAIVDAKYKRLNMGVSREDLYQLHAYASTFEPKVAALAYPLVPLEGEGTTSWERDSPWRTRGRQELAFWRLPVTEQECVERLRILLTGDRR